MDELTLTTISTLDINLKEIKQDICERGCSVAEAVNDYICGLDDGDYHFACRCYRQIIDALKEDGFED